jgi:tRNA threonylcarbamoyladenosine biosynthesis protein TsaB
MLVLALESATSRPSLALLNDQKLLSYRECDSSGSLTPQIIPAIHELLRGASVTVADLEGLAISIGPGTFTGLRVGLATMTAFRFALGIPLVGVSTLEGLAWNLPNNEELLILSTVAIRPDMVYWGIFRWRDTHLLSMQTDQMGKLSDVCAGLSEPTIVLGDGWIRNQACTGVNSGLLVEAPPEALWPSAAGVGRAGLVLLKEKKWLPEGCTPRYIQPSYAETSSQAVGGLQGPGRTNREGP